MNTCTVRNAIAELVNQMASKYATDLPKYNLRIEYWHISTATGERVVHGIDKWIIDEEDLFDHIKKAKRLSDTTISVNDTHIIVERKNLASDEGRTAIYTPEVV